MKVLMGKTESGDSLILDLEDQFENLDCVNESRFKDLIAKRLCEHGFRFQREINIGDTSNGGPFPDRAASAFVDFVCHEKKWFIEAKTSMGLASFTRAFGQCLYYCEILPDYKAFILHPSCNGIATSACEQIMYGLADKHAVEITTEMHLVGELKEWESRI